jgi:MFS family permease
MSLPSSAPTPAGTLGRRASFWVSAAVVAHTLWTSAAPAVTYPLYASRWHLTPTVTTAIFAVYPIAVVSALLLFGNLSDHIGRRTTMLLGLAASMAGVLLFALAPGVGWVFAGRTFMGLGVGLSMSPATAALVEFSAPGQAQRASTVATVATALGFACATLIGGALIEYAPFPLHLNFWVLFAVLAALFGAAWFLPRHSRLETPGPWRPGSLHVPRALVRPFARSALAVTAAFSLGAIVMSLGAQIARDVVGSANALVNGGAIALLAVATSVATLLARQAAPERNITVGGAAAAVSMLALTSSAWLHSLPFFIIAVVVAGAGYGLLFQGGLALINARAPAHERAGTLSLVYLVAYLLMGAIALGLGVAATAFGLQTAVEFGSPLIALLGIGAVLLVASGDRTMAASPLPSTR